MDLLQGVQDGIQKNDGVQNDASADEVSLEKLLKIVKKLNLSVENEDQLKEVLRKKADMGMLGGFMPESLKNIGVAEKDAEVYDGFIFVYLLILLSVVFMILGKIRIYKISEKKHLLNSELKGLPQFYLLHFV